MRRYIQRRWGTKIMRLLWGPGDPNATEYKTAFHTSNVEVEYGGHWKVT